MLPRQKGVVRSKMNATGGESDGGGDDAIERNVGTKREKRTTGKTNQNEGGKGKGSA